jgi:predicted AlkP superfamily phosphohydrolase/phosphomutase
MLEVMSKYFSWKILVILVILIAIYFFLTGQDKSEDLKFSNKATKLYWFIPDGMRAEESLFTVYKWAKEGKLPNIRTMIENGSYGYSIPDFPSHTPVNFASLLTGSHPTTHGVADGPMRIEGKTLERPSVGGFSSAAKKVSPIWSILENEGKRVTLLSMPGSTPPELKNGITIRGRWGNWGVDNPALIFEPTAKKQDRKQIGSGKRLFYFGPNLTQFVDVNEIESQTIESFSPIKQSKMTSYGLDIYAFIIDSTNDNQTNYDKIAFSLSKDNAIFSTISQGSWTDWQRVKLKSDEIEYDSDIRIKAVKLTDAGEYRIRVLFNNLNRFLTAPENISEEMTQALGPMVDFVDNFPPQLVFEPEDKQTFLEELKMSLDYHKKAADFIFKEYKPDVFLHDIYSPNQMLTSKWWMRYVDPKSSDYSPERSEQAMNDILKLYQGLDAIIGEALKHNDGNTLFVLSSDHGAVLQTKIVSFNNLFAQKGWMNYEINPDTGEMTVDWKNTKVIHLQTNNVYINPDGLQGEYKRASGKEYESLRQEVKKALEDLTDEGVKVVPRVSTWEEAPNFFDVPSDRVGDLVIEIAPPYGFSEAATEDQIIITDSITSGNKQAFDPATEGMQTPFIIMGPGVKKGYKLENSINHIDQMPTILKLLDTEIPEYSEGRILDEIFK